MCMRFPTVAGVARVRHCDPRVDGSIVIYTIPNEAAILALARVISESYRRWVRKYLRIVSMACQ